MFHSPMTRREAVGLPLVAAAAQHAPHAPLILEYVGPNDYQQTLQHLRNTMRKVGVSEK